MQFQASVQFCHRTVELAGRRDITNCTLVCTLRQLVTAKHCRLPHTGLQMRQHAAQCCREFENDVPLLKTVATGIMAEVGAGGSALVDDLVHEMVRFGAGELHTVAAVMGGIAAQEAIKLLTHQFVPLSGTLIFNGMAGTSSVFNF